MKTKELLNDRFEMFVNAVHEAIRSKQNSFTFCQKPVSFISDDKALHHLEEIIIEKVTYSLLDKLECKAKLAAAGILGDELVHRGMLDLSHLARREKDEHRKAGFAARCELWGPVYGKKLWDANRRDSQNKKVATATLQVIAKAAEKGYIPASIKEARSWGLTFPKVSEDEWTLVKDLAGFLTKLGIQ